MLLSAKAILMTQILDIEIESTALELIGARRNTVNSPNDDFDLLLNDALIGAAESDRVSRTPASESVEPDDSAERTSRADEPNAEPADSTDGSASRAEATETVAEGPSEQQTSQPASATEQQAPTDPAQAESPQPGSPAVADAPTSSVRAPGTMQMVVVDAQQLVGEPLPDTTVPATSPEGAVPSGQAIPQMPQPLMTQPQGAEQSESPLQQAQQPPQQTPQPTQSAPTTAEPVLPQVQHDPSPILSDIPAAQVAVTENTESSANLLLDNTNQPAGQPSALVPANQQSQPASTAVPLDSTAREAAEQPLPIAEANIESAKVVIDQTNLSADSAATARDDKPASAHSPLTTQDGPQQQAQPQTDGATYASADSAEQQDGRNRARADVNAVANDQPAGPTKTTNLADVFRVPAERELEPQQVADNVDRIVRAAHTAVSRGSSRIQIRLEPPELGSMRIEIRHTSQGIQLQLQATDVRAHQLLQQHTNELRTALESAGLQTNQIDVELRPDLRNAPTYDQQQDQSPDQRPQHQQSGSQQFQDADNSRQQQDADVQNSPAADGSAVETDTADQTGDPAAAEPSGWRRIDFTTVDLNA